MPEAGAASLPRVGTRRRRAASAGATADSPPARAANAADATAFHTRYFGLKGRPRLHLQSILATESGLSLDRRILFFRAFPNTYLTNITFEVFGTIQFYNRNVLNF